jgi:cyclophilin family peptidyl-prolyl cis-trans isomerase
MNKRFQCQFSIFFLVILAVFFSGCNILGEEYKPSAATPPKPDEQSVDFAVANKILVGRLDDIASGKAKPGEPAPATAENTDGQNPALSAPGNKSMPSMVIDTAKQYFAVLHTDQGNITIALNAAGTPITANNFVYLSASKFYDNTVFHRTINGFMIQGGDPKGDGTGGPGYKFADEPFSGEYKRGTVAMANSGPDTNGSQFFIMHRDAPLQKNYVIFGQVIQGIETVDAIAEAPVEANLGGENSKPVTPVKITSVEIFEQ